jgi:hypothetical protein
MHGLGLVPWRDWLGFIRFGLGHLRWNRGFQGFDNDRAKRLADLHSGLSYFSAQAAAPVRNTGLRISSSAAA